MHVTRPLLVRIPDWVQPGEVRSLVNEEPVETLWDGNFCSFPDIEAGMCAAVEYPLRSEIRRETLDGVLFTTEWKGDTVVSIDPQGTVAPLFKRDHLRGDRTAMKVEPDPKFRPQIDRTFHEIDW